MSALTGQTAAATYGGLLKTSDAAAVTSSLKTVEDGLGNSSALQVSTLAVKSTGTLESTGAATIGGALAVTGASTLAAVAATTGAFSGAVTLTGGLNTPLAVAQGGTASSTASGARTALGLGTIATQSASAVAITGGDVTGITDITVADGGTGSSTAAGARTNLGLGTMSTQAASAVAITGGTVTGITDLAVADGGTGASSVAGARTAFGLGTADNVVFNGTSIGGYTGSATAAHKIGVQNSTIGIHMKQVGVAAYSFLEFTNSSDALKFQVDENGATTCSTLTETSARKYKSHIIPLTGNLALAKKLLPCAYVRDGKNEIGFIADEVHAVVPEVVVLDEAGEPASVNYSRLTAILAGAVQELDERLARLEARL